MQIIYGHKKAQKSQRPPLYQSSCILCLFVAVLFFVMPVHAEFRFPMPEFASGYTHPAVHTQMPDNSMVGWDVVVLALTLVLATLLVHKRRSRREIFMLTLFSLAYFGFWRQGCVCSVGSLQNIAAGIFHSDFGVPVTVMVFFALPLVFSLLFGRVFCAAVCPLGAIQEAVAVRPVHIPKSTEKALSVFPYVYLGLTILSIGMGSGFLICQYDPFVGFFRLGASFNMLIFGGVMLILGIFVARPYCRFLCPYGVLLNWTSRLSKWHATITPAECIQCKLCTDSCPYNAISTPTPEKLPETRKQGTRRLAMLIVALPLLMGVGAGVGIILREPLSRLHPTVRLAERIAGEELGRFKDQTIESETFRASDKPNTELYTEAMALKVGYARGGAWFGAFIGLVVGCKLISLSLIRKRTDYEPDRGTCFSCGRCFKYCPVEETTELKNV